MSGQPYRYAKDVDNFRKEYMETLGLKANIDDMNLQANKIYKATGAIPPKSTAMIDGRTTAEILMDTEKLKISLYSELKPICTPQMALLVVQRVSSSPLNGDGSFLVWFAQNATELVANLKKKYKFGIAGNENDAEQMVLFLQSIFSKTKELSSSVKTAFDRPIGSSSLGVEVGDFVKLKKVYDDIYLKFVSHTTPETAVLNTAIKSRFDALNEIINNPPNRYEQISDTFNLLSRYTMSGQQAQVNSLGFEDWLKYTEKIPNPSTLRTLIDQFDKSTKNKNIELSLQILRNIEEMLPSVKESNNMLAITNAILNYTPQNRQTFGTLLPGQTNPNVPAPIIPQQNFTQYLAGVQPPGAQPQGGLVAQTANDISTFILGEIYDEYINEMARQGIPVPNLIWNSPHNFSRHVTTITARLLLGTQHPATVRFSAPQMRSAIATYTGDDLLTVQNLINGMPKAQFVGTELPAFNHTVRSVAGYSMIGFGIHSKRLGRPKGSGLVKPISERIDISSGIKQGHTHVPFGKYIINKNKLDNDIVSFKHVKGYCLKGYPMSKVSKSLGSVMRTIIGGGVPKFEELSNLTEEEKNYLHKVSEKAGITDKLSIPQPSKDQLEKDIHQFEVMKGEILAGNDSPEVIKKFKLILLKLSRNGVLPKREATELMEELLSLGF